MTGFRRTDVKDFFQKSCLSTPSHLTVTAPAGHAAPLRSAGTSTASVSMPETSLTLRCGPEGPCYRNPVCPPPPSPDGDSPLLRGAIPLPSPPAGGPVAGQSLLLIR